MSDRAYQNYPDFGEKSGAVALTIERKEAQKLLRVSRKAALYPKVRSDAAVIYALEHGLSFFDVDALEFDWEQEVTYADLKQIYELRVVGKVLLGAGSKYYYQLGDIPDYTAVESSAFENCPNLTIIRVK